MATNGNVTSGPTIINAIRQLATEDPEREAFVFIDKFDNRHAITRQALWDYSQKFAAILKRHGIEKGDVVCNTLVNSPDRLITAYGTITAGAITMHGPLVLASGDDLRRNLRTSQCKAVILDQRKQHVLSFFEQISYRDELTGEIRYNDLPYLKTVFKLKLYNEGEDSLKSGWLHDLKKETETFVEESVHPDDVAAIFSTSGTTGFSKLVPQTHRRLLPQEKGGQDGWKISNEGAFYSSRALGWYGGFPHVYNRRGTTMALTNYAHGTPQNMALHMIKVFEEEKCDNASLAVIEVEQILEKMDRPLSNVMKSILVGGGPIPAWIERALDVITRSIFVVYGATEAGTVSTALVDKKMKLKDHFYCGKVLPGVQLKIVNGELKEVCASQQGEIVVRTPDAGGEYLNDPLKTQETFGEGGWVKTGDIGFQDSQGHLYVLGRKSNAIMKGTLLLYPEWLETKVLMCPGIQKLAIIGVPDRILYEDICLCVVKTSDGKLTKEDVHDFCQKLFLTNERDEMVLKPRYILFFDDFPFNANLKMDRAALKVEACKRLGIEL